MHSGLADVKFPGCGAHGGPVLNDVLGQAAGPLLHVSFHTATSPFGSAVLLYAPVSGPMRKFSDR